MPYKDINKQRDYQRLWCQNRRRDYMKDKQCVVCGCTENLEIDHIDPDLKVSHRIWSWSAERQQIELAKCQILCEDCHKKKTQEDMHNWRLKSRHNDSEISDSPDDTDIALEPDFQYTDIPF